MRKGRLASAVAGAVAGLLIAGIAVAANEPGGNPTPANKAVAAGDSITEIGPGANQTLLSATLRTSKPTDLLLSTSLECTILTKLNTNGSNASGAKDTDTASGDIRAWLEIDDDPNDEAPANETGAPERVVPVMSTSQPPQDGSNPQTGTVTEDAATFCNRTYQRTVEDEEGVNDPDTGDLTGGDGIDRETDYIKTKSAHGFNWVLLNAGSGIHYIRFVGTLTTTNSEGFTGACTDGTETAADQHTCATALIGNRTLIIEPTKMANDAQVLNSGS
jgi:hypothetical protein